MARSTPPQHPSLQDRSAPGSAANAVSPGDAPGPLDATGAFGEPRATRRRSPSPQKAAERARDLAIEDRAETMQQQYESGRRALKEAVEQSWAETKRLQNLKQQLGRVSNRRREYTDTEDRLIVELRAAGITWAELERITGYRAPNLHRKFAPLLENVTKLGRAH